MEIQIADSQFNDVFYYIEHCWEAPEVRYCFIFGGSSSSKTYSMVQCVLVKMLSSADRTMIFKKVGTSIPSTIYQDFVQIIDRWGLSELFSYKKMAKRNDALSITCKHTGAVVSFSGCDDVDKLKGLSSYKRFICDEIDAFTFDDYNQLLTRLRGHENQKIFGLFNPVSENHWIKKAVFDKADLVKRNPSPKRPKITELCSNDRVSKTVTIRTTYLDNKYITGPHFVDVHVIEQMKTFERENYDWYKIYGLGLWGTIRAGFEFYKHFAPVRNVRELDYDPALPLHISFDENVNPYAPAVICQIQGREVRVIDEITLEHPRNTVADVCHLISQKYVGHRSGMFIYGDATAKKQDAKLAKGDNFFTLILQGLATFRPLLRLSASNPPVVMRGNFINKIFLNGYKDLQIFIGSQCSKTIEDFQALKENADGTKAKSLFKNSAGVTCQQYGHLSDALDYLICEAFKSDFIEYQRGSESFKKVAYSSFGNTI